MELSASFLFGIILGAPLLGSLLNGLIFRRQTTQFTGWLASAAMALSLVGTCILFLQYHQSGTPISIHYFDWMVVGNLHIPFSFYIDALSLMMGLVVTGIGGLIHIYAIGYMAKDATPYRFFSYMNLFVVAMLILVYGANLPIMFIGWEGVGLCSYLLIGYWYENMQNAIFGMKAFVVNRIGDLGFLLGIFGCFYLFGTLDFSQITEVIKTQGLGPSQSWDLVNVIGLCLFVGAVGKSAQIPLYVWLPDAMAGPTPVSALIHAATMVTSGLVLLTRMSPLYGIAPLASEVVLWTGTITAVFAAVIGLAQNDIKKVLAYSTVSQLGYMFAAMGAGAYVVGMFHVFTHACFKALLFLGAGSVIVGMHHEQDMRNMGGLRKKMPLTFWTMAVGTLALAGIFPFAGFFSKDEILFSVFRATQGISVPYVLLVVGAGLTAFYMARLMIMTFWGKSRADAQHGGAHVKESPAVMTLPLVILAVLSTAVGFLGMPHFMSSSNIFNEFFALGGFGGSHPHEEGMSVLAPSLALVSLAVAVSGLLLGVIFYAKRSDWPQRFAAEFHRLYQLVHQKFRVDELYDVLFTRPLVMGSRWLWRWIDTFLIDGMVNQLGRATRISGGLLGLLQSGNVQTYALFIVLGVVLLFLFFAQGYWY